MFQWLYNLVMGGRDSVDIYDQRYLDHAKRIAKSERKMRRQARREMKREDTVKKKSGK